MKPKHVVLALLVPLFGVSSAALILGERFDPTRMLGMVLVLSGLVIVEFRLRRPLPLPDDG